jgi:hypothetical protein
MFKLWGSKPEQPKTEIRDTLFGDLPWEAWPHDLPAEPWVSFGKAKKLIDSGHPEAAIEVLRRIVATPQLESRVYLQAWEFLRQLGVHPPSDQPKQLLGVVVEVGLEKGVDLVAAWTDHHARYYNFSGSGVIWEHSNDSLDALIDDLLRAGLPVLHAIGPWEGKRRGPPANDVARVNLLSPSGLHFGEGPFGVISKDNKGGPVLAAALHLMQAMMKLHVK